MLEQAGWHCAKYFNGRGIMQIVVYLLWDVKHGRRDLHIFVYICIYNAMLSKHASQECGKRKYLTRIHKVKYVVQMLCVSIGTKLF